MKIKNLSFIVMFLVLLVLCYCSPQNTGKTIVSAKCDTALNLDTPFFTRFNIINRYGKFNPAVKFIQFDIKRAELKNFINGYDSIAIRVWHENSGEEIEVVEIRKHCDGWTADLFTIKGKLIQW